MENWLKEARTLLEGSVRRLVPQAWTVFEISHTWHHHCYIPNQVIFLSHETYFAFITSLEISWERSAVDFLVWPIPTSYLSHSPYYIHIDFLLFILSALSYLLHTQQVLSKWCLLPPAPLCFPPCSPHFPGNCSSSNFLMKCHFLRASCPDPN